MAKVYYHHVAQKGVADLTKTVFQQVDASILTVTLAPHVLEQIAQAVRRAFPSGRFNC
jgi:hypothetical protein